MLLLYYTARKTNGMLKKCIKKKHFGKEAKYDMILHIKVIYVEAKYDKI